MRCNNIVNRNNRLIIIIIYITLIISSCTQKEVMQNEVQNTDQARCDSMIYILPEITTDTLASLLEGKEISRCGLLESEDNTYFFSFEYDDKTVYMKRDSILLQKTNTFLKVKDKYYPVISTFDNLFSDISRPDGVFINEFNFCSIEVDAQGNLINTLEF